jgi:hypothetical protein
VVYTSPYSSPARYQWEANSAPSQSYNCGPTCVTKIAQFYRDTWYGIQATRRLAVSQDYRGTSANEQATMLSKRGVAATVYRITSLAQLKSLLGSGRRPVLIGFLMSTIPAVYRDHPFLGWHAVTLLANAIAGGTSGIWVNDPNFSPPGGIRPDPDGGRKFYPDWVIANSINATSGVYAVVPNAAKTIASASVRYANVSAGARVRHYPYNGNLLRTLTVTTRATYQGDFKGSAYTYWNGSRWVTTGYPALWSKVRMPDGLTGYVIKPFVQVLSGLREALGPSELDLQGDEVLKTLEVISEEEEGRPFDEPIERLEASPPPEIEEA